MPVGSDKCRKTDIRRVERVIGSTLSKRCSRFRGRVPIICFTPECAFGLLANFDFARRALPGALCNVSATRVDGIKRACKFACSTGKAQRAWWSDNVCGEQPFLRIESPDGLNETPYLRSRTAFVRSVAEPCLRHLTNSGARGVAGRLAASLGSPSPTWKLPVGSGTRPAEVRMESAVASVTPGLVVGTVSSQRVQHGLASPGFVLRSTGWVGCKRNGHRCNDAAWEPHRKLRRRCCTRSGLIQVAVLHSAQCRWTRGTPDSCEPLQSGAFLMRGPNFSSLGAMCCASVDHAVSRRSSTDD